MISIDFLGDLFAALNELLRAGNVMPKTMDQIHFDAVYGHIVSSDENDDDEDDREFTLDVTESLTICHTALSLLTGPRGESLEIDPKTVADALYSLLPKLAKPAHTNLIPIALEALRFALLMRRQLSMARVAAFVKASLALAIHTPAPHASLALIGWVRQLIMRYPSVGSLLENSEQEGEEGGGKTDGRVRRMVPLIVRALLGVRVNNALTATGKRCGARAWAYRRGLQLSRRAGPCERTDIISLGDYLPAITLAPGRCHLCLWLR